MGLHYVQCGVAWVLHHDLIAQHAVKDGLGTAAPTILFYLVTGSALVLALGIVIFVFDVIYIGMPYQRFRDLGLNPITREPAH